MIIYLKFLIIFCLQMSIFYDSEQDADDAAERIIERAEREEFTYNIYNYVANTHNNANERIKGES